MIKEAYMNVIMNNEVKWVFTIECIQNIIEKNPRYILDRPELAKDKNVILGALLHTSEEFIEEMLLLTPPKFYEDLKTLFGDHKEEVFIRFFRERAMIYNEMNKIAKMTPHDAESYVSSLKLDIKDMAQAHLLNIYGRKYFNTIVNPCEKAIAMCKGHK